MSHCPSHDWDRYIAAQDGPMPVGKRFVGKSKAAQQCELCYGNIAAGEPHQIQFYHDDDGHFMSPDRSHLEGKCLPLIYDEDLGEMVYAKPEQGAA